MLSDSEKRRIRDLYIECGNYKKVARQTGHSKTTVLKTLHGVPRKVRKSAPVKKKLDKRTLSLIRRHVNIELTAGHVVTSASVKTALNLQCHLRTIQRALKELQFVYEVQRQQIRLSPEHKRKRKQFAEHLIDAHADVNSWIFSDEKKFNGDGPDHLGTYAFKNASNSVRQKRQMGGIGVMVFGAVSPNGKLFLKVGFFFPPDPIFVFRLWRVGTTRPSTSTTCATRSSRGFGIKWADGPSSTSKTTARSTNPERRWAFSPLNE